MKTDTQRKKPSEIKRHIQAQMIVSEDVITTEPGKRCSRNGAGKLNIYIQKDEWTSPYCIDKNGLKDWSRCAQMS